MSLSSCFSKVSRNGLLEKSNLAHFKNAVVKYSKIWEPDYLILAKTKTPEYDLINFQIKGYDFAILEQFQRLIHSLARKMNLNVSNSWAAPQQDVLIHHYKPNSTEIEYKYNLKICERNIQIVDVKSHMMSIFIEAVLTACPPGVNISVHEHTPEIEENRYVPDLNIIELEQQLEDVGSKKKKKPKSQNFTFSNHFFQ